MTARARSKKARFDPAAVRRREIERHARHVGASDTEDFGRWLVAWVWHNAGSRDHAGALQLAAERMGRTLTHAEAITTLEQADEMRQHRTADKLAKFLGITFSQRTALGITSIGSIDVNRRGRALLRKRRRRLYLERRRRSRGARPRAEYEANSLARAKPWEAEGMSRRTWYRRIRGTGPKPANPTLKNGGDGGTSAKPAIFLSADFTPVPTERKQGASGVAEGGWEGGVFLTARWIAAREKACGCRHNRSLPADLCPAGGGMVVAQAIETVR
jgi:hypothetical protein